MTDIIKAVRTFTEAVGCTTDRFNARQTALYTGLQCEELMEKLEAIGIETAWLRSLSDAFKRGEYDLLVANVDREAMLDADIDLAWVTIGSAFSQGADVCGAAGEVMRANMDKLHLCHCEDADYSSCEQCNDTGRYAIKDENGKVRKPTSWTPPNIAPFTADRFTESEGGVA